MERIRIIGYTTGARYQHQALGMKAGVFYSQPSDRTGRRIPVWSHHRLNAIAVAGMLNQMVAGYGRRGEQDWIVLADEQEVRAMHVAARAAASAAYAALDVAATATAYEEATMAADAPWQYRRGTAVRREEA